MKIGVLTFHFAHNYGAMLQSFALKTYLSGLDYDIEIVNYVPEYMRIKYYHVTPIQMLLTCKRSVVKGYFKRYKNIKQFRNFEKEFLNVNTNQMLSKAELSCIEKKYDAIIFGSDQIWNTLITHNDMTYFGDFSPSIIKISYAASVGNALQVDGYEYLVHRFIANFQAISVREKNAQFYLKDILDRDIACVLDPVFLLSREYWIKMADSVAFPSNPQYILYYTVQNNQVLANECENYAKKTGLKVYSIHGEMKKTLKESKLLNGIGPLQFLTLIKNAEVVFTNSFHAVAFSIIFNIHSYFRVHSETGNRVIDLLKLCGCDWDGNGLYENRIDIYKNLYSIISDSQNFLKHNLYSVLSNNKLLEKDQ